MIIFIAGAHGVGKSTLCSNFILTNDFIHRSASQLISQGKTQDWDNQKKTDTADDNQLILIRELNKIKKDNVNLLLDGHFVLIDSKSQFIELKKDVFKDMELDGVILIECDDELIEERFEMREAKLHYEPENLRVLERKNAEEICEQLSIPLKILFQPSIEAFESAVNEIAIAGDKHPQV